MAPGLERDEIITWDMLKKDAKGLVPCIVQDAENGDVLSARIEGLLPVKKVESVKEAEGNAN